MQSGPTDKPHICNRRATTHQPSSSGILKSALKTPSPQQKQNQRLKTPFKSVRWHIPILKYTRLRSGRLHEFTAAKGKQVMRLHRRMAHAPEDVCAACRGDRPLWTNTKLTEKDIRRFFERSPADSSVSWQRSARRACTSGW